MSGNDEKIVGVCNVYSLFVFIYFCADFCANPNILLHAVLRHIFRLSPQTVPRFSIGVKAPNSEGVQERMYNWCDGRNDERFRKQHVLFCVYNARMSLFHGGWVSRTFALPPHNCAK